MRNEKFYTNLTVEVATEMRNANVQHFVAANVCEVAKNKKGMKLCGAYRKWRTVVALDTFYGRGSAFLIPVPFPQPHYF